MEGTPVLKRAQRLWELTRDSADGIVWQILKRTFEAKPRLPRKREWSPNLDFVEAVWRDAGNRNPDFGVKVAEAYGYDDRWSHAADVLLEIVKTSEPTAAIVARCLSLLDTSNRAAEADMLIQQFKERLVTEIVFLEAWAYHALHDENENALSELIQAPAVDLLQSIRPSIAAQVYFRSGLKEEADTIADKVLREVSERPVSQSAIYEAAELFRDLGRWDEFEKSLGRMYPPSFFNELRDRMRVRRRRG